MSARLVAGIRRLPDSVVAQGSSAEATDAVSAINVSMRSSVLAGVARVPQYVADGLFAALGRGAADTAELAIVGSRADLAVRQALAAEMSAAGSAQANLDSLLWASEDSSWQDGERDWLP
jgi:hypothetical protein